MIDLGVALAWISISAVSVVGLSAYVRAATISGTDAELASCAFDDRHDSHDAYLLDAYPMRPIFSRNGIAGATAGDVGARSR